MDDDFEDFSVSSPFEALVADIQGVRFPARFLFLFHALPSFRPQ